MTAYIEPRVKRFLSRRKAGWVYRLVDVSKGRRFQELAKTIDEMNPDQEIIPGATHDRRSCADFYPHDLELERRGIFNAMVTKAENAAFVRIISKVSASGASASILTVHSREIHQQVRELETLALSLAACYKNNDNAGFITLSGVRS